MANKSFVIEMPEEDLAALDAARGDHPRQTWVKALIASAVAARARAGGPCDVVVRYVGETGVAGENMTERLLD